MLVAIFLFWPHRLPFSHFSLPQPSGISFWIHSARNGHTSTVVHQNPTTDLTNNFTSGISLQEDKPSPSTASDRKYSSSRGLSNPGISRVTLTTPIQRPRLSLGSPDRTKASQSNFLLAIGPLRHFSRRTTYTSLGSLPSTKRLRVLIVLRSTMSPNPFTLVKLMCSPHQWNKRRTSHDSLTPKVQRNEPVPGIYEYKKGRGWYLVEYVEDVEPSSNSTTSTVSRQSKRERLPRQVIKCRVLDRWMFTTDYEKRRHFEYVQNSEDDSQVDQVGFYRMDDGVTYVRTCLTIR